MKCYLSLLLVLLTALAAHQLQASLVNCFSNAISDAGGTDTLYVSETETTYLLFPDDVLLVDIGRTGEYFAKIEGKSVFLKARHKSTGPTNILVRFGQAYYTARIIYADFPSQNLYDLRKMPVARGGGVEDAPNQELIQLTLRRLQQISGGSRSRDFQSRGSKRDNSPSGNFPSGYSQSGYSRSGYSRSGYSRSGYSRPIWKRARHGMSLRLTQLQNDKQASYLCIYLANNTSIDYKLDFVGFSFLEKRGKLFSKNNSYRKEVRPYSEMVPALIPAHGESELWYALPLFAMTSRGRLEILFREKHGARTLRVLVPARMINRAALLEEGHEH